MKTITVEWLKKHHACKDGVKFVERNKLEGFPLERLNEVKGDYDGYVSWMLFLNSNEHEYDSHGNVTKKTYPNGRFWLYEYDVHGNMTKKTYSNGSVSVYEYDERGNMTKKTLPNGYVYEYDHHGNITKRTYPDGSVFVYVYEYEYDSHDNITKITYPEGSVSVYEYVYYDNGQLKSIKENGKIILSIPKF